jgi:hypothetical protein
VFRRRPSRGPLARILLSCRTPVPVIRSGDPGAARTPREEIMNKAVIGIVQTMPEAETIVADLRSVGFRSEDISVLRLGVRRLLIAVHSANGEMRMRADAILTTSGARNISIVRAALVPKASGQPVERLAVSSASALLRS